MNIIQTPSPHFNGRSSAIDAIIIHYTDMVSAEMALNWIRNSASHVSAHYLIDEKGCIYQMVKEEHRAWHAGESYWQGHRNLNDRSIGIELANPGHSHGYEPFPEAQIEALIGLCGDIKERWNIPTSRILGHSDIAPRRKQDPGHLFPWSKLAHEGLGLWPLESCSSMEGIHHDVRIKKDAMSENTPKDSLRETGNLHVLTPILSQLGYEIESPLFALLAFQRHFQPHKVDGIADQETYALGQGLLKSQDMFI
jgi:N-acetylmuramoyl-L-alanine amidase